MLNLAEYRNRADRLADHLPWAALVAPGVVLNKDGSFQRTLRFRGPDLESATEAELVSTCARANNVLRRFGSGWALFFEGERIEALGYPESSFPDPASWLVDEERRAIEGQRGQHFESAYHLTLLYMPPADRRAQAERALLETGREEKGRDWRRDLAGFIAETDRVFDLLAGFTPEVRALDNSETLTYLHGAVSTKRHRVAVPETPMYLDSVVVDTSLSGGIEPMLGDAHLSGPPLLYAETSGSTPFRFSTHVGDVGHMLIVGPTGAGKSVLLALLALQFRRYADSQVTIFDKGNSARAAVLAMGGEHHALGSDGSLAFQPLRGIDDPAERSWAAEWVGALVAHEKVNVDPQVKEAVWSALTSLASAPVEERTLTGFSVLLQSNALKAALMPYTLDGPFGRLLDAAENRLVLADVQCFETEELMHEAGVVLPVLISFPPAGRPLRRSADAADPGRSLGLSRRPDLRRTHPRMG